MMQPHAHDGSSRLELNVDIEIKSPHRGPITWLDVDSAEERYLLTGEFYCHMILPVGCKNSVLVL